MAVAWVELWEIIGWYAPNPNLFSHENAGPSITCLFGKTRSFISLNLSYCLLNNLLPMLVPCRARGRVANVS